MKKGFAYIPLVVMIFSILAISTVGYFAWLNKKVTNKTVQVRTSSSENKTTNEVSTIIPIFNGNLESLVLTAADLPSRFGPYEKFNTSGRMGYYSEQQIKSHETPGLIQIFLSTTLRHQNNSSSDTTAQSDLFVFDNPNSAKAYLENKKNLVQAFGGTTETLTEITEQHFVITNTGSAYANHIWNIWLLKSNLVVYFTFDLPASATKQDVINIIRAWLKKVPTYTPGPQPDMALYSPHGGSKIRLTRGASYTLYYQLSDAFQKRITPDIFVELYLVRADGVIEGFIDRISDYTRTEYRWDPYKLQHWGGLDTTIRPPEPGEYKLLIVARTKTPIPNKAADYPVDIFVDGYDQYDGKKVLVIRDGKTLAERPLLAQDASDSPFTLLPEL